MTKFTKRLTSVIMAAAMATSMAVSASAVSWDATHVNYPGAPTSESTDDYVTVYHRTAGAKATCNYTTHTNASATKGYTWIYCDDYYMSPEPVVIEDQDYEYCVPDIGSPTSDIAVNYTIAAHTDYSSDTFRTKGNIIKIS